ncbi:MAG: response regulator [Actinomycetota bacterium]
MPAKTILLVDDDEKHLMLHAMILSHAGFRPITAVVGQDTLDVYANEHPALIFLDYQLHSQISARQAAGLLHERYPDVPLVVLSSLESMPDDVKDLATGFLHKGDPGDLVKLARRLLGPE